MDITAGGHTILEWMQIIGLGALVGAAGQCMRTVAGLRKLNDYASATNQSAMDLFVTSQLVVSLVIGAVAGTLGAISLGFSPGDKIPTQTIITLLGIGYAGADFIEAFIQKQGASLGAATELGGSSDGAGSPQDGSTTKSAIARDSAGNKIQPVG